MLPYDLALAFDPEDAAGGLHDAFEFNLETGCSNAHAESVASPWGGPTDKWRNLTRAIGSYALSQGADAKSQKRTTRDAIAQVLDFERENLHTETFEPVLAAYEKQEANILKAVDAALTPPAKEGRKPKPWYGGPDGRRLLKLVYQGVQITELPAYKAFKAHVRNVRKGDRAEGTSQLGRCSITGKEAEASKKAIDDYMGVKLGSNMAPRHKSALSWGYGQNEAQHISEEGMARAYNAAARLKPITFPTANSDSWNRLVIWRTRTGEDLGESVSDALDEARLEETVRKFASRKKLDRNDYPSACVEPGIVVALWRNNKVRAQIRAYIRLPEDTFFARLREFAKAFQGTPLRVLIDASTRPVRPSRQDSCKPLPHVIEAWISSLFHGRPIPRSIFSVACVNYLSFLFNHEKDDRNTNPDYHPNFRKSARTRGMEIIMKEYLDRTRNQDDPDDLRSTGSFLFGMALAEGADAVYRALRADKGRAENRQKYVHGLLRLCLSAPSRAFVTLATTVGNACKTDPRAADQFHAIVEEIAARGGLPSAFGERDRARFMLGRSSQIDVINRQREERIEKSKAAKIQQKNDKNPT